MKTILVPTDFSNNAYCALFYAAKLFENNPSKIILLHSYKGSGKNNNANKYLNEAKTKCIEVKHKLIVDLDATKHVIDVVLTERSLPKAINRLIKKEKIDFVVMGSRGNTINYNTLLGRNSLDVIKTIQNTPLLIIPDELDYKEPKKIGFITGFNRLHALNEMIPIIDLATKFEANVNMIHIRRQEKLDSEQTANFHELSKILKQVNAEVHWINKASTKYKSIMSYIENEGIDILAMYYHEHDFITKLFHENVIKDISNTITIPYLILPKES